MKLSVKITPNAKKDEVIGWEMHPRAGTILKIRISARPVEGQANKAIIAFLSKLLKTPKSSISIAHGETGRIKLIELPDSVELMLDRVLPLKKIEPSR
ncbi:MAG: DUF167 domain-containing protein [Akkermansia sp.]